MVAAVPSVVPAEVPMASTAAKAPVAPKAALNKGPVVEPTWVLMMVTEKGRPTGGWSHPAVAPTAMPIATSMATATAKKMVVLKAIL
jgi:hypothetical protein